MHHMLKTVTLKVKWGRVSKLCLWILTFYIKNGKGGEKQTIKKGLETQKAKGESFGGAKPPSPK